jgi:threonine/homoserine/homoserine lactone efflux protein
MFALFSFTFIASFLGTVPPSPSNLAVMHTVLNRNTRAGLWLAFGASFPELPHCFLALMAIQYLSAFRTVEFAFHIMTAAVLCGIGVYILFSQYKQKIEFESYPTSSKHHLHPFWKGVLIGIFNPMIFAFWLVTAGIAADSKWLNVHDISHQICFVAGAAAGAFILLALVAFFTRQIKKKLSSSMVRYFNYVIAVTFLFLGILQVLKYYFYH